MSFLSGLETLLGMHQGGGHPQPQQQAKPDFTYNPNPATNIPNSTHNLQLAQQQHGQVPQQQPQQPGLAPHPLLQLLQVQPTHQPAPQNVGQGNGFVNSQQFPQLNQGGRFNPGFSPLQNSQSIQPAPAAPRDPQANNFNPQQGLGLY